MPISCALQNKNLTFKIRGKADLIIWFQIFLIPKILFLLAHNRDVGSPHQSYSYLWNRVCFIFSDVEKPLSYPWAETAYT